MLSLDLCVPCEGFLVLGVSQPEAVCAVPHILIRQDFQGCGGPGVAHFRGEVRAAFGEEFQANVFYNIPQFQLCDGGVTTKLQTDKPAFVEVSPSTRTPLSYASPFQFEADRCVVDDFINRVAVIIYALRGWQYLTGSSVWPPATRPQVARPSPLLDLRS